MSRRSALSPLKTVERIIQKGSLDPRDEMIQKLKDELIKIRGRERELAICESALREILEKSKLLMAEKVYFVFNTGKIIRIRQIHIGANNPFNESIKKIGRTFENLT
jgi:hypothetical protein